MRCSLLVCLKKKKKVSSQVACLSQSRAFQENRVSSLLLLVTVVVQGESGHKGKRSLLHCPLSETSVFLTAPHPGERKAISWGTYVSTNSVNLISCFWILWNTLLGDCLSSTNTFMGGTRFKFEPWKVRNHTQNASQSYLNPEIGLQPEKSHPCIFQERFFS